MSEAIKATFAPQVSFDTSTATGSYQAFSSTISQNGAILIFDNQSTVSVTISDNGTTDGKTLAPGSAFILDLRTNREFHADDFTYPIGTQFYAKCSAGTGSVYISTIYARN